MDTFVERVVAATAGEVYALAAAVEDWPRLLPHYRFVRVITQGSGGTRTVEMAAWRDVWGPLRIPLHWTAIQTRDPRTPTLEFRHVRGITTEMWVAWTFEPLPHGATRVRIRHVFTPNWPIPDVVVRTIVGDYFVNGVARRTLALLAERAERAQRPS